MYKERNHIKVFVSSTVYDFESQLDMVYSTLDGYGYDVMMSSAYRNRPFCVPNYLAEILKMHMMQQVILKLRNNVSGN